MRYILIFSLEEHNSKYRPTYLNFREHFRSSMNRNPTAKFNTHLKAAMTGEFGGSIDVPPLEIIPDMTELPSFLRKDFEDRQCDPNSPLVLGTYAPASGLGYY